MNIQLCIGTVILTHLSVSLWEYVINYSHKHSFTVGTYEIIDQNTFNKYEK